MSSQPEEAESRIGGTSDWRVGEMGRMEFQSYNEKEFRNMLYTNVHVFNNTVLYTPNFVKRVDFMLCFLPQKSKKKK